MPDRESKSPPAAKPCVACGRAITWRRKWARDWASVKYCSDACRRNGKGASAVDVALEQTILALLDARANNATICPSEAARAVAPGDWRPLMEAARSAARRLMAQGCVTICQNGRAVADPSRLRGPIRIRRA